MGEPDLLAKQLFREETKRATFGICAWTLPSPITLKEVHPDGLITIRDPERFLALPAPWCLLEGSDEALIEVKMPGDHMEPRHWLRALMRRFARDVVLHEKEGRANPPLHQPLWWLSPHIPKWIRGVYTFQRVALGCYRVEGWPFEVLWVCANELPLDSALIPFLCARSGQARRAFVRWVRHERPVDWMVRLLRVYNMTDAQVQKLLDEIDIPGDEESERFCRAIVTGFLKNHPKVKAEIVHEERAARLKAEQQREQERLARLEAEEELAAFKAKFGVVDDEST